MNLDGYMNAGAQHGYLFVKFHESELTLLSDILHSLASPIITKITLAITCDQASTTPSGFHLSLAWKDIDEALSSPKFVNVRAFNLNAMGIPAERIPRCVVDLAGDLLPKLKSRGVIGGCPVGLDLCAYHS